MSSLIKTKVNILLEAAIKRHQSGQLEAANLVYEEIHKIDPNNVNALQLSGLLAYQVKQYDDALILLSKAISIDPNHVQALIHRALVLNELGRLEEAINDLNKVILIEPKCAAAYNNRANLFVKLKEYQKALDDFDTAIIINPDYADAFFNRGNALQKLDHHEKAIESFNLAISLCPDHSDAIHNCGISLQQFGKATEALLCFDKALQIQPDDTEFLLSRGNIHEQFQKNEDALKDYNRALSINPNYADAIYNRGTLFYKLERFDEALSDLNQAVYLKPDDLLSHLNRGLALRHLGRYQEALADLDKVITLDRCNPKALSNRGAIRHDLSRFEEALSDYDKALLIDPEYPETYLNKAQLLLLLEDFGSGWPLYEWRFKSRMYQDQNHASEKPMWSGEKNKHVFVWNEQGIGDEIMYSSIIPELAAISSELTIRCDRRLIPLFERSFPKNISFITKQDPTENVPYDFHIPIASLPLTFRLTKDSFVKAPKSFLKSDSKKASILKNKILNGEERKIIGISWKTASRVPGAIYRQINLTNLASHLSKSGARLVNLQYGDVTAELSDLKKVSGIEVLQVSEIDNSKDLDGLAALITACDEVISTSNATVHLAGALGRETKALIPLNRAWWWGVSDDRSYWYKSVQLRRQNRLENWSDIIEKL